jgi:hypothetical protein
MQRRVLAAVLLCVIARVAVAQTVRGVVVAEGDRPLSGVVVLLVDAQAKEIARTLTDRTGDYRLVAPRPGNYRLRTLRIGFKSSLTDPITLAAGDDITRRLSVSPLVVSLDTVRATGRNPCKVVAADSASAVAEIWDQVRSALIATQLSFSQNVHYATSMTYQRTVDARSQRVGTQSSNTRSEYAKQPWTSLGLDSLRTVGYVFNTRQNTRLYYAPDLTVLLSDLFLEGHCFRIARTSTDDRLGVDFEPTSDRRNVTEIRGTLWLDRRTNELTDIEFRYANGGLRPEEERAAGGDVSFARMQNGLWTISQWNVRMPIPVAVPVYGSGYSVSRYDIRVDSIKVTGAELLLVTTTGSPRDTIWMRAPTVVTAMTPVDSASPRPTTAPTIIAAALPDRAASMDTAGKSIVGDPSLEEFENRRKRGLGRFIPRAEIERRGGYSTAGLLQGLPGLRIASGQSGEWAYNSTQRCSGADGISANGLNASSCSSFYVPTADEAREGIQTRCFTKVYVDRALMNPGTPTPPYNLRDIIPAGIEAIEYYSQAAEMPVEYRGMNSSCGLIIIHRRRAK